jgi:hypothetical protein
LVNVGAALVTPRADALAPPFDAPPNSPVRNAWLIPVTIYTHTARILPP